MIDLEKEFGRIDIYVFDQLLRGNIAPGASVLDAGCGAGRNLVYLLRAGFTTYGVDQDPAAVAAVRELAASFAPALPRENFRVEPVEAMTFDDATVDVVLCSAVLHFAEDDEHFWAMLRSLWRVLKPGGLLFCRLASSIGMEDRFAPLSGRRFTLLDGTDRYLVDAPFLEDATRQLGGKLVDPLKTTVVHEQRCMTTWVLRKDAEQ